MGALSPMNIVLTAGNRPHATGHKCCVIQSAFNDVMCIYFVGTFRFRGVLSKQIYLFSLF